MNFKWQHLNRNRSPPAPPTIELRRSKRNAPRSSCLFSPSHPSPFTQPRPTLACKAPTSSIKADGPMCISRARRHKSAISTATCSPAKLKTTSTSIEGRGAARRSARLELLSQIAAKKVLWPHIEPEYQQELKGIVEGLHAQGSSLDLWDVVALNGVMELRDYYLPALNDKEKKPNPPEAVAPGKCSALHRYRFRNRGWKDRHRAQQLVFLRRRRALD
jgi:hypothetical protein